MQSKGIWAGNTHMISHTHFQKVFRSTRLGDFFFGPLRDNPPVQNTCGVSNAALSGAQRGWQSNLLKKHKC